MVGFGCREGVAVDGLWDGGDDVGGEVRRSQEYPSDRGLTTLRPIGPWHTHGGQVKILGRAPAIPRGSGSYVEGWYQGAAEAGGQARAPLYVSRGIGTTFLPVRLGSTPEIAVFD